MATLNINPTRNFLRNQCFLAEQPEEEIERLDKMYSELKTKQDRELSKVKAKLIDLKQKHGKLPENETETELKREDDEKANQETTCTESAVFNIAPPFETEIQDFMPDWENRAWTDRKTNICVFGTSD